MVVESELPSAGSPRGLRMFALAAGSIADTVLGGALVGVVPALVLIPLLVLILLWSAVTVWRHG